MKKTKHPKTKKLHIMCKEKDFKTVLQSLSSE